MAAQATDEERRAIATHLVDNAGDRDHARARRSTRSGTRSSPASPASGSRHLPEAAGPGIDCHTPPLRIVSDAAARARLRLDACGRPARGDRRARGGDRAGRPVPDPARHHRVGQVVHDRRGDRRRSSGRRIVLAPNKSLAAQLASEFRELFPKNRVEYFVSYYDYYQPEAYLPTTDTYIEKDSSINDEIDRLRHSATSALMSRRDVIIVASVSAIYGLGAPDEYARQCLILDVGEERDQRAHPRPARRPAVRAQRLRLRPQQVPGAGRHDRGVPGVRGAGGPHPALRRRGRAHRVGRPAHRRGRRGARPARAVPGVALRHRRRAHAAARSTGIEAELAERLAWFEEHGKLLEAQRLRMRTTYDLEMLREIGVCSGIENYSRHLDGRAAGEMPYTLLDYFPDDYLVRASTSRTSTVPQLHGQYEGDRSRKDTLVEHGFRLPSAMDNRPLRFDEFVEKVNQVVFLSATPSPYEIEVSTQVVEQIVRPTGLIDPEVDRAAHQGPDRRPRRRDQGARRGATSGSSSPRSPRRWRRTSPTTCSSSGIRVRYLHSEVDTLERVEILRGPAARRVRRARRHQPAAGGPRPARGVAGRDPRRRQGGLPPVGDVADPDDRPRRPQRRRPGDHVRRPDDRLDAQAPSPRRTAGARSSSSTTPSTASTRRRCARRSPTSSRCCAGIRRRRAVQRSRPWAGPRGRQPQRSAVFDLADVPPDDLGRLIQTLQDEMHEAATGPAVRGGGAPARRDHRAQAGAARRRLTDA